MQEVRQPNRPPFRENAGFLLLEGKKVLKPRPRCCSPPGSSCGLYVLLLWVSLLFVTHLHTRNSHSNLTMGAKLILESGIDD